MKTISIVIPVFNDELYLEKCIDSVINQSLGIKNIEIILIDDASSDNSFKIAKRYKEEYPDNFVIDRLDKNSGSGGKPRNIGIELATGKYLMFSDADDFFDKDAFKVMYNAIESNNADFIISNWSYTDEKGKPFSKPVFDEERFNEFKLDIKDYKDSFWIMNSSMCNKIFNREFIINNKIRCLENVNGEDTFFSDSAFLHSKNVYYIKDVTYYYRQRSSKKVISNSYNCTKSFFDGMNIAYKSVYNLFVEFNEIEFYRYLYARNMTYLLYRFIDSEQLKEKERIQVLKDLKWFFELNKILNIPTCQESIATLIDLIINDKITEALKICNIISEYRNYIAPEIRKEMSKPTDKIYNEMLNNKLDKNIVLKKVV